MSEYWGIVHARPRSSSINSNRSLADKEAPKQQQSFEQDCSPNLKSDTEDRRKHHYSLVREEHEITIC